MVQSAGTKANNVPWIIGFVAGAIFDVALGLAVGTFLLIGIAMGGDAAGEDYSAWATTALFAYPVVIIVIIAVTMVWGLMSASTAQKWIALILMVLAVPIAAVIALALTQIGLSVST